MEPTIAKRIKSVAALTLPATIKYRCTLMHLPPSSCDKVPASVSQKSWIGTHWNIVTRTHEIPSALTNARAPTSSRRYWTTGNIRYWNNMLDLSQQDPSQYEQHLLAFLHGKLHARYSQRITELKTVQISKPREYGLDRQSNSVSAHALTNAYAVSLVDLLRSGRSVCTSKNDNIRRPCEYHR